MEISAFIFSGISIVIAVIFGIYISFTVRCKGPIFIYPWIWMEKKEREEELAKVNIKALYKHLTVMYSVVASIFVYLAVSMFSSWIPIYPVSIAALFISIYIAWISIKFTKSQK